MDAKQRIARRVAQELRDGDIVNLGIGLPTMVANYLPEGIKPQYRNHRKTLPRSA